MSIMDIYCSLITAGGTNMIAVYENQNTKWCIEKNNEKSNQIIKNHLHENGISCRFQRDLVNYSLNSLDHFNSSKKSLRSSLCVEIKLM